MPGFTAPVSALRAALSHCLPAVEPRNHLPILQHALLVSGPDGCLILVADNLDMRIEAPVTEASCDGAILCCAPALPLLNLLSALPANALVSASIAEDAIEIEAGGVTARYPTLPAADFMAERQAATTTSFRLSGQALGALLDRAAHAISTEETRYYLNGICLCREGEELVAVATDGHRLAAARMPLPEGAESLAESIIPRAAIQALRRLPRGPAALIFGDLRLKIITARWVLSTKLIDGTFPDWRAVMPKPEPETSAVLRIDESRGLLNALALLRTLSPKECWVQLLRAGTALELRHAAPERGEIRVTLPAAAAHWEGPDLPGPVITQRRYLQDLATALPEGCEIRMVPDCVASGTAIQKLQAALISAPDFTGALMPMSRG